MTGTQQAHAAARALQYIKLQIAMGFFILEEDIRCSETDVGVGTIMGSAVPLK